MVLKIFKKALADTLDQAGGVAGIVIALFGPCAGLGVQAWREGFINLGWASLLYGIAGFVAVVSGLLLFNLLAAPYRLELERRLKAEKKIEALESISKPVPNLILSLDGVIYGGQSPFFPGMRTILISITVTNVGALPSAAAMDSWKIFFTIDGNKNALNITIIPGNINLSAENGRVVTVEQKDMIFRRMENPVQVGGLVNGYLFAIIEEDIYRAISQEDILEVQAKDVFGNTLSVQRQWGQFEGEVFYSPIIK